MQSYISELGFLKIIMKIIWLVYIALQALSGRKFILAADIYGFWIIVIKECCQWKLINCSPESNLMVTFKSTHIWTFLRYIRWIFFPSNSLKLNMLIVQIILDIDNEFGTIWAKLRLCAVFIMITYQNF